MVFVDGQEYTSDSFESNRRTNGDSILSEHQFIYIILENFRFVLILGNDGNSSCSKNNISIFPTVCR